MTSPNDAPQYGRSVAVSLFEREPAAREALDDLRGRGVDAAHLGLLSPDSADSASSGLLANSEDVSSVLRRMGVPDGEARFYDHEVRDAHRTLVVVEANGDYASAREVLLSHGGYDVQSRGGDLAAADDAGVPGGTGAMPADLTRDWRLVASRYEMLWEQHYGTSDATWEQMEPVYRFAWQAANEARLRGRPWSEVESTVRRAWESSGHRDWDAVAGPIHDVWEDVAEEAAMGAEGGEARRIPRQGTD